MSTSDGSGAATPPGSPGATALPAGEAALTPGSNSGESFARALEQLANAYFAGLPGPALNGTAAPLGALEGPASAATSPAAPGAMSSAGLPGTPGPVVPPRFGPSAFGVGAGGASPTVSLPPVPGPVKTPPLMTTPLPKESDLRAVPTLLSDNLGLPSVVALASTPDPGASATPYFLELAGLPADARSGSSAPYGSAPSPGAAGAAVPHGSAPGLPYGSAPGLPYGSAPGLRDGYAAVPYGSGAAVPNGATVSHGSGPRADEERARTDALGSRAAEHGPSLEPHRVEVASRAREIFDANAIRRDFPILQERVHGRRLVWLDNGATTQKPRPVIDRISYFYEHENSNVHRGAHTLAARSTDAFEAARRTVQRFLAASSAEEIVFVRGTTEGINLIAKSWGRRHLHAGDEIVITWLEHHANIVPWQQLCSENGCRLRVAPVDDRGQVILEEYEKLLNPRTRIVSFTHVSNALGTIVPVRPMVEMAHRYGAVVHVDGAQAVAHTPVDVQSLDVDFYTFSGHKVFGPTGIGAVFGKRALLEAMPPWQGGGNMIADVTFERTTYQPPPGRFEAGTNNIADAVGLGAALDYVSAIGLENISRQEHELLAYGTERLLRVPGLRMIGTAPDKAGVMSFVLDGVRTEDVGWMLDQEGIAVRAGHHCAQPILRRFGLESTVRATLALYNTRQDVDALVAALLRLQAGRPAAPEKGVASAKESVMLDT